MRHYVRFNALDSIMPGYVGFPACMPGGIPVGAVVALTTTQDERV